MRIVRYVRDGRARVGVAVRGRIHPLPVAALADLLAAGLDGTRRAVEAAVADDAGRVDAAGVRLLPPVDGLTEVWASGVTYRRSSEARQEESRVADVYARVYEAERPELFVKAPSWRVVGTGEPIGVRTDSPVNVPEPELALVCDAAGRVVGLTVCDDVSSRSIEGENPLYLPQAKVYSGSCALGPAVVPVWAAPDPTALTITVAVHRGGDVAWHGEISTAAIHRDLDVLVEHLYRQATFPHGAVLSTGTGLVPGLEFSLAPGDVVRIDVSGVGTLVNPVRAATREAFAWLTPDPARAPD